MEPINARFFGRESIIQDLVQGVLAPNQPLDYSLVGPKMIGKSRLLRHLASPDGPLKSPALAHQRPARCVFRVAETGIDQRAEEQDGEQQAEREKAGREAHSDKDQGLA